jgi:hypothetical protein
MLVAALEAEVDAYVSAATTELDDETDGRSSSATGRLGSARRYGLARRA